LTFIKLWISLTPEISKEDSKEADKEESKHHLFLDLDEQEQQEEGSTIDHRQDSRGGFAHKSKEEGFLKTFRLQEEVLDAYNKELSAKSKSSEMNP